MTALSRANRITIAGGLALISTLYFAHVQRLNPAMRTDLDVQIAGAKAFVQGRNPYRLIGPGREVEWGYGLAYPAPTLAALTPIAWLALPRARLVFVAVTSFLFFYAVGGVPGRWRYLVLLSKPYQGNLLLAQWGFVMAAAWILPAVAALAIAKPNIGAAVVAARFNSRTVRAALVGACVLLLVSFIRLPTWPQDWIAALSTDPNRGFAIMRPGGILLALALLKWRRPEARLLFTLSIIPQTLGFYDALILFFVPRRASECIALIALSHFAFLMVFNDPALVTMNGMIVASGTAVVHWLYLPCLAMILLRPNEGLLPASIDRASLRLPLWLRGAST